MSGIAGIWNLRGRPLDQDMPARLAAALAHRGPDGQGHWIDGPVGLAARLHRVTRESGTEVQPLVGRSGAVVVFDGRLDNREELLGDGRMSPGLPVAAPDPALVLAAYETFDDGFVAHLAGDFAVAVFDPRRQRLLLARDAIGIRPLYYAQVAETFLFASEIKALLTHPQLTARPRDDVLADFVLDSARSSEAVTCFDDVFSVPPSHVAIREPGGFRVRRYWDFDRSHDLRLGSFEAYAEGFREHFSRAVRRRCRSAYPVAVSVSGGLDSSAILCVAETGRRREPDHPSVLGLTYSVPDGSRADEHAFVRALEHHYGIVIAHVCGASNGVMNDWTDAVWRTETPFLDGQWDTTDALVRDARARGARTLLTGHWGDQVLWDPAYLIDLARNLRWRTVRQHLHEHARWSLDSDPHVFRRRFWRGLATSHGPEWVLSAVQRLRARRHGREWYTSAFRRHAGSRRGPTAAGPAWPTVNARSLYETVRSRYHGQCLEWNNKTAAAHGVEMAFPFLDRDLLSFMLAIPGEMRAWRGVPKALLREGLRGIVPEVILARRWKGDFTQRVNERLRGAWPAVIDCLRPPSLAVAHGYLRETVGADLSGWQGELRAPTCTLAWNLLDMLGLELWLKVFVGRASRPGPTVIEPREATFTYRRSGGRP